jgi:hypothetical protein
MKCNLFAVIALAIASISLATSTPANAREYRRLTTSRFDQTCTNMRVFDNILEAECLTRDGRSVYTNIPLRGIQNIDGNLVPSNSNRISNFSETCGYFSVRGNELQATCQTRNGGLRDTSIALNDIDNIDGTLRYRNVYRYNNASYIIPQMF